MYYGITELPTKRLWARLEAAWLQAENLASRPHWLKVVEQCEQELRQRGKNPKALPPRILI